MQALQGKACEDALARFHGVQVEIDRIGEKVAVRIRGRICEIGADGISGGVEHEVCTIANHCQKGGVVVEVHIPSQHALRRIDFVDYDIYVEGAANVGCVSGLDLDD